MNSLHATSSSTPPPGTEPAVHVLSSMPRGRFTGGNAGHSSSNSRSHHSRPLSSDESHDAKTGLTREHNQDSQKSTAIVSDDEALALCPEEADARLDLLSRLPFEVSIYILLLADPFDVARARQVSRAWCVLCSDNQVWRDHFHRNPAWRIRPDLLQAVQDQAATRFALSKANTADAEEEDHPVHLDTPTTSRVARTNKSLSRSGAGSNTGQSKSSSLSKKSGVSTADLLGLSTDLLGMNITPSPFGPPQHQQRPHTARPSSQVSHSSFSTPSRPSHVVSSHNAATAGSPHLLPSEPVPSPYFIKPLRAPLHGLNWLELYKTRFHIDQRWRMGDSETNVLKGHKDNIYCIRSDSDYIITGSRDPSVKIWDLKSKTCKHTIEGMPTSVLCLDHDGTDLVFGCSDASIHIYSMKTWTLQRQLRGHTAGVLDISLNDDYIASSSKDCSIRIWDRKTGEVVKVLREHEGAVNALGLRGDRLLSAGGDTCLKLWSIPSGQVLRTFSGHERGLACFAWDGDRVVSGGNDKSIRIWDVNTGKCIRVLEGHTELVRCLAFDAKANRIVSGSYDRTVRVWDAETGEPCVEFRGGHSSYVFGVTVDSSRIITCSHDKRVIILDFGHGLDVTPFV